MSWSASLSYDVHGVKVDEVPSWAGLGWTLNAPGVITRSVIGDPDETINYYSPNLPPGAQSDIFELEYTNDLITEHDFRLSIATGAIETQPDIYYFNFGEYTGKFVFSRSRQIVFYEFSGLTIIPTLDGQGNISLFTVFDPAGRRYVFDQAERTRYANVADGGSDPRAGNFQFEFTSSWFLSEVTSPGGEEKLVFTYDFLPNDYTPPINHYLSSYLVKKGNAQDTEHCGAPEVTPYNNQMPVEVQVYERRLLSSIRLESTDGGVREELHFTKQSVNDPWTEYRLSEITVKRRWQSESAAVRKFKFSHDFSTGRLTLKSMFEQGIATGGATTDNPPYLFGYHSGSLPAIASGSIDHWGYYNGCGSNLIPTYYDCQSGQNIFGVEQGNRESDEFYMKMGALNSLTYPTGGRTEWELEANVVAPRPCFGDSETVGGLRVKTVTDYATGANVASRRTYKYVNSGGEASSGMLFSEPGYLAQSSYTNYPPPGVSFDDPPPVWADEYTCETLYLYASSQGILGAVQGSHVGYSRIEEILGTESDNIGKNVYFFNAEPINGTNEYWSHSNGDLIRKEVFDKNGAMVLKEELHYSYELGTAGETRNKATVVGNRVNSESNQDSRAILCQVASSPPAYEWRVPGGNYIPQNCIASKRFKSRYKRQKYFIVQRWKYVYKRTTTEYFYENGTQNTVVKEVNYTYDDTDVNLPTAQYFANSDGAVHRMETRYNKSGYIKGIPEEITYMVGGQVVGGMRYTLSVGKPVAFYEKLKDGTDLLRATITSYTPGGMPLNLKWMTFPTDVFQWQNGLMTQRDKLDWRWKFSFNERRLLTSSQDIDGQTVNYTYDSFDRLSSANSREGNIASTYSYTFGSPNKISSQSVYSDAPAQTIIQEFDGLGRPTRTLHNGALKKEQFYDAFGRLYKETYLPGNYVTYFFDDSPLNRIVKTLYPDASYTETHYNAANNYYKQTGLDEKGNPTTVLTDLLGRKTRVTDALGGQTNYVYDAAGNLEKVSPPIGQSYEYTYDVRNRLKSKKVPGAGTQHLRYDNATDLLLFSVDAKGNRVDYSYDTYGRELTLKLATGVQVNPEAESFGSPGSLIKETVYGEPYGGINVGKIKKVKALMFDGGSNMVSNDYTYDTYGRLSNQFDSYQIGGVNVSDDWTYTQNHADWQTNITRQHSRGAQSLTVTNAMAYDNFGREVLNVFGGNQPYAMAVSKLYNDRDELILKKYGSLGGPTYLEKVVYEYTERGWLRSMNPVVPRKDDRLFCAPPTHDSNPDEVHEETQITIEELLDLIATGDELSLNELDPCANGDCYEQLASYRVSFDLNRARNNGIVEMYAGGSLIPLSHYPYLIADSAQLRIDLSQWLSANGYVYQSVKFEEPSNRIGRLTITQTNLHLNHIIDIKGIKHPFARYDVNYVPCKNLQHTPIGEASQQAASAALLDASMPTMTPAQINYPSTLYKVYLPGIGIRWVLEQELPTLKGPYQRLDRVPIAGSGQSFAVWRTNGAQGLLTLTQLLGERTTGTLERISPKTETNPVPECHLEPLGCTPYEQAQQNTSLASIASQTAQLNAADLSYPLTIYLVQLCDGSTTYIVGQNLLNQLSGPHIVLDQLTINGPGQTLTATVIRRDPLFAMDFKHEANGNIEKARWKVTNNNVKFYRYSYDALNRLTNADYGDIYLLENAASGSLSYHEANTDIYKGFGYEYDAIGNIEKLSRYGMINVGSCQAGIIDDLTYSYNAERTHLTSVADNAPIAGRDKGFKPKAGAGEYVYDLNGNLTTDPHKDMTITYNFLNLPSQITKTGPGGGSITLTYDALGRKYRKTANGAVSDYLQGIEYKDGKLEAIYAPEGRLAAVYDGNGAAITHYRAEYWLKDHLGNTRLAFSDENNDGRIAIEDDPATPQVNETEIMAENHYYPFGMNQEGPWYTEQTPANQYRYNGKELNEDLGLNWIDYGARWYDASLGRWWSVDPLGEKVYHFSPYHYSRDNPIIFYDVNGEYFTGDVEFLSDILNRLKNIDTEESKSFIAAIDRMQNAEVEFYIARSSTSIVAGIGGETYFDLENNRVVLDVFRAMGDSEFPSSDEARGVHELEHGRQFLDGETDFLTDKETDKYSKAGPSHDKTDEEKAFAAQKIISDTEAGPTEKLMDPKAKVEERYSELQGLKLETSPAKTAHFEKVTKSQGRKYISIYNYKSSKKP